MESDRRLELKRIKGPKECPRHVRPKHVQSKYVWLSHPCSISSHHKCSSISDVIKDRGRLADLGNKTMTTAPGQKRPVHSSGDFFFFKCPGVLRKN